MKISRFQNDSILTTSAGNRKPRGEILFERCWADLKIPFKQIDRPTAPGQSEPQTSRPDYLIRFGEHDVVCEVKEIGKNDAWKDLSTTQRAGIRFSAIRSPWRTFRRGLEDDFRSAMKQDRGAIEIGLYSPDCPLIVVLYSQHGLPPLSEDAVAVALKVLAMDRQTRFARIAAIGLLTIKPAGDRVHSKLARSVKAERGEPKTWDTADQQAEEFLKRAASIPESDRDPQTTKLRLTSNPGAAHRLPAGLFKPRRD